MCVCVCVGKTSKKMLELSSFFWYAEIKLNCIRLRQHQRSALSMFHCGAAAASGHCGRKFLEVSLTAYTSKRIVWTDVKCLALANKSCQAGTNYKKIKNEKWQKKNARSLVKVSSSSSSTRRYNNNKGNNNNNNKNNNERGIIAKAFHMSSSFALPSRPAPKTSSSVCCCVWWGVAQKLEIYLWSFCSGIVRQRIQSEKETMYSLPLLSTPMPRREGVVDVSNRTEVKLRKTNCCCLRNGFKRAEINLMSIEIRHSNKIIK